MTGFQRAVEAHTAGRLDEAERGYQEVLRTDPRQSEAWHLLGLIAEQRGDPGKAVEYIQEALKISGPRSVYLANLGTALEAHGQIPRAADALRHALTLDPRFFMAHLALGNVLRRMGEFEDAVTHYRQAAALEPGNASAYNNLGNALKDLGRVEEAVDSYRHAIALRPQHAGAHYNLGTSLKELGCPHDAVQSFLAALSLHPDLAEAHLNLGATLHDLGQLEGAATHARRAVQLNPKSAAALSNLGTVLRDSGNIEEAMACYAAAIALQPNLAEAWHNQGVALQVLGRNSEALTCFKQAQVVRGDFAEAAQNAALVMLASGQFEEGWKAYDDRWQWPETAVFRRSFPHAQWRGEDDASGILVWSEQGLGDNVLCASMIPDLLARNHKVVMETDQRLVALFERSFPGITAVPRSDPPHLATRDIGIRWHTPTGSLGRWLRPTLRNFPARPAYLKVDQRRRDDYRAQLNAQTAGDFLVGISWRSQNIKIGKNKSVELTSWAKILRTPGASFIDLQYGNTTADRAVVKSELGAELMHLPSLDLREDIDGVAALAAACDIVISVSSAVAHLAAAVGCPTWVLVPRALGNLWYWMCDDIHTPWYPSVTIYRQKAFGEWDDVLDRVHADLAAAANNLAVTAN